MKKTKILFISMMSLSMALVSCNKPAQEQQITAFTLETKTLTILPGSTGTITWAPRSMNVSFSGYDEDLITIRSGGLVISKGMEGETDITVTASSGASDVCHVIVTHGGSGGDVTRHDSLRNAFSYDYSDVTIMTSDSGADEGSAYIYIVGEGQYIHYQSMFGSPLYRYYADYQNDNYTYWDYTNEGGTAGWLNYNDQYEVNLSLYSLDFYLPNLLNKLTDDDVEYSSLLSCFYVKDSALQKVTDEIINYNDAVYHNINFMAIMTEPDPDNDKQDRLKKIVIYDDPDNDNSPYLIYEFGNYGTTKSMMSYMEFPPLPNEDNVKDYWTITGREYVPNIYPDELTISVHGEVEHDDTYDVILDLGETCEFDLVIGPENYNKVGLISWHPDASEYKDYDGNYTEAFETVPAVFNFGNISYKTLSARHPGEVEVYVTHTHGSDVVTSNKLKVLVRELEKPETENTLYNFQFTGETDEYNDFVLGKSSGYFQTVLHANNLVSSDEFNPDYDISGFHVDTLPGAYTDTFEETDLVLAMNMGTASSTSEGLDAYVDFDFGDQPVKAVSFYYGLHKTAHIGAALDNLKELYLATSEDGINWTMAYNFKTEFLRRIQEDSSGSTMIPKLLQFTFSAPTRYFRIFGSASFFGKNYTLVFDEMRFYNDEISHVEKEYVDVTSIVLNSDSDVVRVGNDLVMNATVNPLDATNKKHYWTSSDNSILSVYPNKDGSVRVHANKAGKAKITVLSDAKDGSGERFTDEIEITVLESAEIPDEYDGLIFSYKDDSVLVQFTFHADLDSVEISIVNLTSFVVTTDTLYLTNEADGIYTFKSDDSKVFMRLNGATVSVVRVSGEHSMVKGIDLNFYTLNKKVA